MKPDVATTQPPCYTKTMGHRLTQQETNTRHKTERGVTAFWHYTDEYAHTKKQDRWLIAKILTEAATDPKLTADFWTVISEAHQEIYHRPAKFDTTRERIIGTITNQIQAHNTPTADPFAGLNG